MRAERWSLADVARMRLLSQRLVDPLASPTEVVRHLTCTQGQDYPGSSVSIALRTTSRRLQDVRDAYDSGTIVRSWPMRGTLFVVPAEDLGWMLGLTSERVRRETTRRREQLGLQLVLEERVGIPLIDQQRRHTRAVLDQRDRIMLAPRARAIVADLRDGAAELSAKLGYRGE